MKKKSKEFQCAVIVEVVDEDGFITNCPKSAVSGFVKSVADACIKTDRAFRITVNPSVQYIGKTKTRKRK